MFEEKKFELSERMSRPLSGSCRSEGPLTEKQKKAVARCGRHISTWKGDDVVLRHSHVMTLSLVTCSISLSTNLAGVAGYLRTLA